MADDDLYTDPAPPQPAPAATNPLASAAGIAGSPFSGPLPTLPQPTVTPAPLNPVEMLFHPLSVPGILYDRFVNEPKRIAYIQNDVAQRESAIQLMQANHAVGKGLPPEQVNDWLNADPLTRINMLAKVNPDYVSQLRQADNREEQLFMTAKPLDYLKLTSGLDINPKTGTIKPLAEREKLVNTSPTDIQTRGGVPIGPPAEYRGAPEGTPTVIPRSSVLAPLAGALQGPQAAPAPASAPGPSSMAEPAPVQPFPIPQGSPLMAANQPGMSTDVSPIGNLPQPPPVSAPFAPAAPTPPVQLAQAGAGPIVLANPKQPEIVHVQNALRAAEASSDPNVRANIPGLRASAARLMHVPEGPQPSDVSKQINEYQAAVAKAHRTNDPKDWERSNILAASLKINPPGPPTVGPTGEITPGATTYGPPKSASTGAAGGPAPTGPEAPTATGVAGPGSTSPGVQAGAGGGPGGKKDPLPAADEALLEMDRAEELFKPEFLQLFHAGGGAPIGGGRIGQTINTMRDRLGVGNIPDEEKKSLQDFQSFETSVANTIPGRLAQLGTGARGYNPQEFRGLQQKGLLLTTEQDPVRWLATLHEIQRSVYLVRGRAALYDRFGAQASNFDLNKPATIINARGNQLIADGEPPDKVKAQLLQEFPKSLFGAQ